MYVYIHTYTIISDEGSEVWGCGEDGVHRSERGGCGQERHRHLLPHTATSYLTPAHLPPHTTRTSCYMCPLLLLCVCPGERQRRRRHVSPTPTHDAGLCRLHPPPPFLLHPPPPWVLEAAAACVSYSHRPRHTHIAVAVAYVCPGERQGRRRHVSMSITAP